MCILRIAAVIIGLGAVPVLFASAETLSSRARGAERQAADPTGSERTGRAMSDEDRRRSAKSAVVSKSLGAAVRALDRNGAPTFGRIVINPNGEWSFEGQGSPGADVSLTVDTKPLGDARADEAGVWRLNVASPLPTGDHVIASSSRSGDLQRVVPGQEIRIAIPEGFAGPAVVPYEAPPARMTDAPLVTDSLRSRAEELAAAASQRFTQVTETAGGRQSAQAPAKDQVSPKVQTPEPGSRTAPPQPPAAGAPDPVGPARGERLAAPVLDWLEYSAREYQRAIVKPLSAPASGGGGEVQAGPAGQTASRSSAPTADRVAGGGAAADVVTDAQLAIQEWLARANRTYQTEIIRKLQSPAADARIAVPPATALAKPATKASAPTDVGIRGAAHEAAAPPELTKPAADAQERAQSKPIEQVVPVAPAPVAQAPVAQASAAEEAAKRESDEARRKDAAEARRRAEDQALQKADEEARQRAAEARRADQQRAEAEAKWLAKQKAVASPRAKEATSPPPSPAGQGDAGAATKAADLARKAVEAARSGAAKRAAETATAPEPAKSSAASGASVAKPGVSKPAPDRIAAEGARSAKPAPRAKDDRIPEGSGEKGPVDAPQASRSSPGKSVRAPLAADAGPADSDRAGRTAAAQSASGRKCARAGRDIRPPGTYVIGSGDTLSEIAERHYGSARRMGRIVKANRRKLRDPDVIRTCQRIWLP